MAYNRIFLKIVGLLQSAALGISEVVIPAFAAVDAEAHLTE